MRNHMSLTHSLANTIRSLRALRSISQEELAYGAGIDRRYLSDVENGKRNISLDVLERFASYFNIPLSRFIHMAESGGPFSDVDQLKESLIEKGFENAVVLEAPDFIEAVTGVTECGKVVYSYSAMIGSLMSQDEMTYEEAIEFLDFNTIRALPYMGENAPVIMYDIEP